MQTEAARGNEWFVGTEAARRRVAVRDRRARRGPSERVAVGVVLALAATGAAVLALAVALAPGLYTPFF